MTPEKRVQSAIIAGLKKRGCKVMRVVTWGERGLPDLVVVHPLAGVYMIECKAPGKKPDPRQRVQHAELHKAWKGCVHVVDDAKRYLRVLDVIVAYDLIGKRLPRVLDVHAAHDAHVDNLRTTCGQLVDKM